jgi:hypothetical protein
MNYEEFEILINLFVDRAKSNINFKMTETLAFNGITIKVNETFIRSRKSILQPSWKKWINKGHICRIRVIPNNCLSLTEKLEVTERILKEL